MKISRGGDYRLMTKEHREKEKTYVLRDLSKVMGGKPSYNSLLHCATAGRRALNGKNVKLEVCRDPSGISSSIEAYNRFLEELNQIENGE